MSLRAVGLKFSLMREHEKNVNNFECKRDIETGISWFYRAVFHVILESLSPQIEYSALNIVIDRGSSDASSHLPPFITLPTRVGEIYRTTLSITAKLTMACAR